MAGLALIGGGRGGVKSGGNPAGFHGLHGTTENHPLRKNQVNKPFPHSTHFPKAERHDL